MNPAPLLYHFEHPPVAEKLSYRYDVHYTTPAQCATELHAGDADVGLIPIAELTPDLAIVPGCAIASLREVRSILLLVRNHGGRSVEEALRGVLTVAADSASRSSAAYLRVILERFFGLKPRLMQESADPGGMLQKHDAALLIGDPALLAREHRTEVDAAAGGELLWLDLAQLWVQHTGLPWVAAVWAVRPEALAANGVSAAELIADLNLSREAGQAHTEQLVAEWAPRLAVPAGTIRTYLTENIHYVLTPECLEAIRTFRTYAAESGVLPELPELNLLHP